MYHRWKWHSIMVVCAFVKEILYCNKFCFVAMHGIVDDGDTRLWGGLHFHKNWLSSHCDNPPPLWLAKLALFTPGGHGGLAKRPSDKLKCLFQHFSWEKETNPDKRCGFNSNIHQPVQCSRLKLFPRLTKICSVKMICSKMVAAVQIIRRPPAIISHLVK